MQTMKALVFQHSSKDHIAYCNSTLGITYNSSCSISHCMIYRFHVERFVERHTPPVMTIAYLAASKEDRWANNNIGNQFTAPVAKFQ